MTPSLLTFQEVRFGYNRTEAPVFDGLDLSLKEGRITAILGPNGAGKTTLLYLVLGWLKPWAGKICLLDIPIENYSRRALGQHISLIPQSEHTPFEYTVLEYVLLGRAPYLPPLGAPSQDDEKIAYEALVKMGIGDLYDHSILTLSGGERQMVLAARALAQEPKLLLLDEPTSHLDLSNKVRLVHILRKLKNSGTTILMSTHEPELALALSDDTILMEKGRVLTSGRTAEMVTEENLSKIYHIPVKTVFADGKKFIAWM
ncbi:ABC transporter ATP-binding protein [Levilinea saccharolytica]|uniref:ABC transporter domain-containing protein n=1 Tax=Levilinea saccharolytica TaxID=229921 RepID=A0A0P6X616_9CHLR|nr:ABC transporter ATP-binding protein [Levilinea saccharolytica]KPL78472.1 hypothetical protein ADN01_14840 [Levilinea saccharolytica]GAP18494.1 ABC-type cobalamin/Fe3+-siderophores transport system, ATPase component [Levilinea saccharolytica]